MSDKNELQLLLDSYTADMQKLVSIKAKDFDTMQTATLISSIPERKWNAAQGVVTFTLAKKEADRVAKVTRAVCMLKANQQKDKLTNADDRKAWVEDQAEVQDADMDAFNADTDDEYTRATKAVVDDTMRTDILGPNIVRVLKDHKPANDLLQKVIKESIQSNVDVRTALKDFFEGDYPLTTRNQQSTIQV